MTRFWVLILAVLLSAVTAVRAGAEDLTVQLPAGTKVISALANEPMTKLTSPGIVHESAVTFKKLLPATAYNLSIALADGTVLQGVDLDWYNEEAVHPKDDPLTDDDRKEISGLVKPDKDFFNKIDILQLSGDHNRATALVKQIRDRAFHSDKGGEIISRFELWYFRFEYGGWEKVQQGQKVLRRDRFASQEQFEKTIGVIRWVPELGGVKIGNGESPMITLTGGQIAGQQATQTSSPPDTPAASSSSPASSSRPAP